MNDQPPGPGWWRANDGNWYPPESHPDAPKPNLPAVQPAPPADQGQYIPPGSGPQFGQPGFGQQPPGAYGPPGGGPYGTGPGGPAFPPQMPYGGPMPYGQPVPYALSAPRRRRSGGCFPVLVAVVFLGIAVFIGVGLVNSASETEIATGGGTPAPAPVVPDPSDPYGADFAVNQEVPIEDGTFKVLAVRDNYIPANEFDRPEPGFRYVAVEATATNNGSDQKFASIFQFEIADSLGRNFDPTFVTGLNDFNGSVASGETRRGWLAFEVPKDSTGLRLKFLLGSSDGDGIGSTAFVRL